VAGATSLRAIAVGLDNLRDPTSHPRRPALAAVRKAELPRPLEQAELLHALDQRKLQLVIGHRIKLARAADFNMLSPITAENGLSLYRRVPS
jgi:hypothetical protein